MRKILLTSIISLLLFLSYHSIFANAHKTSFQANRDYLVLPASAQVATHAKHQITVVEFFSYGSPWSYHLDPLLNHWLATKSNSIVFERVPVTFAPHWNIYAQAYYVAKELGVLNKLHPALFKAIQEQHLKLSNEKAMEKFFLNQKINKEKYALIDHYSPGIPIDLKRAQALAHAYLIYQAPTIVINGKYKIDPSLAGNPKRMMAIMLYLLSVAQKDAPSHTQ